MNDKADANLNELFLRYWDDVLTDTESLQLRYLLTNDPAIREQFEFFCLQAVVVGERLSTLQGQVASGLSKDPLLPPSRRWSRRRVLRYLGVGVAASLAALVGERWYGSLEQSELGRLTAAHGAVKLETADGKIIPLTDRVPLEGTVSTCGPTSSAVLSYPDGTAITFAGDTVIKVTDNGRRLILRQGTASVRGPSTPPRGPSLTLATNEAVVSDLNGAVLTVGRILRGTEVGVHHGQIAVSAPSGEPLDVVRQGELLTVGNHGNRHKGPLSAPPTEFAWDLANPLPDGWHVGYRELTEDGPVVRPQFWFDPFHLAEMCQIRSDKQWARGFFQLMPESVIQVRYWVDRPGPSQLVICVRTPRATSSMTGVLECNDAFVRARPGEWQWLEVKAGDMIDNMQAPTFPAPWVGFLVIFNTYRKDLGLKIAEFRVTGPRIQPAEL